MNLRGKQKRFLRARANRMRPLFSIGKDGLSETWLTQVNDALNNRELMKVNILQNSAVEPADVREFVEANSQIQVVQTIGRTVLLFKIADQAKHRHISEEVKQI
ncbi:ribosome assembly RNA-binding protein YhbY [Nicoliella spurrieriana]|uniref:Ribosome assembly RNA-binding protein YhbY n=1 Tax=Nicoliella spurrieriana TaxID=2925830 RepID=A0A976X5L2_9LACO|nr:ribosome assembly RNA-binding protein YhbY [Nicoliella spurrieriana]UQS86702.1 ribosome assembly RNA-binding protein YhbY [Nicoliella spurrieriana]